jgi:lysophospholipase L1-like esterase
MLKTHRNLLFYLFIISGLILSLWLNFWLFRQSRHYERQYFWTRLDPLGLDVYAHTPAREPGPLIVFYGDSRARQWVLPHPTAGISYLNRGIDGQSSRQALLRYDSHIAPLKPEILVVQVGVNDLLSTNLLADERAAIIAATQANLASLVARAHDDGTTVVLTTIFPSAVPSLFERLTSPAPSLATFSAVNAYLHTLAAPRIIVFDTVPLLTNEQSLVRDEFKVDRWHLNDLGYARLNDAIVPLLTELATRP